MTALRILARPAWANRAVNPYNALLADALVARGHEVVEYTPRRALSGRFDLLHLHWPEAPLNAPSARQALVDVAALLAVLRTARHRGTRLVWTAHNLGAHEARHPRLEAWFWRRFLALLDGVIVHGESVAAALADHHGAPFRRLPRVVIPHGHYRGVYGPAPNRLEARRALGLPETGVVLAHVGLIRPYKDLPRLIQAFRSLPRSEPLALVIAGKPNPGLAAELETAAGNDARIHLELRFLEDAELPRYLAAADGIVLPYRRVLNSGSALLALSYDRPILAPASGALRDLATLVGPPWVHLYTPPFTVEHLAAFVAALRTGAPTPPAPLEACAWPRIAAATEAFYQRLIATSSDPGTGRTSTRRRARR